jgi:hypothetical protein
MRTTVVSFFRILTAFLACIFLVAGGSSLVGSQPTQCFQAAVISDGFAAGHDLNRMPQNQILGYVQGFVNAVLAAPLIGAPVDCIGIVRECMIGRSDEQLAAMLRKYLADNPDKWHYRANILTFNALIRPCF